LKRLLIVLAFLSVVGNILFIGLYRDWSDSDLSLFIKTEPINRYYFWSPAKYYRYTEQELSAEEILIEQDYLKFCSGYEKRQGLSRNPLLWLQFSISLILVILMCSSNLIIKLVFHFLVSLWITLSSIVYLLIDNSGVIENILMLFAALFLNIFIMKLMERVDGHSLQRFYKGPQVD
jgi:hypothetical protein